MQTSLTTPAATPTEDDLAVYIAAGPLAAQALLSQQTRTRNGQFMVLWPQGKEVQVRVTLFTVAELLQRQVPKGRWIAQGVAIYNSRPAASLAIKTRRPWAIVRILRRFYRVSIPS